MIYKGLHILRTQFKMGFCPVPHSFRDQVWLGVGALVGLAVYRIFGRQKTCCLKEEKPKKCVLHYFKGRGRAEGVRWMLAVSNIKFSCPDYNCAEDFADAKKSGLAFLGQLPVLEVDNNVLVQSNACILYIAKCNGLYPADSIEAARCDMLAGASSDLAQTSLPYPFAENPETVIDAMRERLNKLGPFIEAFVKQNLSSIFVAGGSMTYGDVVLSEALSTYVELIPGCLESFPALQKIYNHVTQLSNVKDYLKSDKRHKWKDIMNDRAYARNVWAVLSRPTPSWL
eukprot:m.88485 g.88485  ORF g.88485 m.88485 type:complete len:285 (+) comp13167_c0_seq2:34-888(+)